MGPSEMQVYKQNGMEMRKLEAIRIGLFKSLSNDFLSSTLFIDITRYMDRTVLDIRGKIMGENLEDIEISYPKDWWQHLKQRWFPKFLLKHCPVQLTVHKLTPRVLYPEYKPLDNIGPHVFHTTWENFG